MFLDGRDLIGNHQPRHNTVVLQCDQHLIFFFLFNFSVLYVDQDPSI